MNNNFSSGVLFKINLINDILKSYHISLFSKSDLIRFDESIFSEDFLDFYLARHNDLIHFSITKDEITIDIDEFDECIILTNEDLEDKQTIEILYSLFNGYINLTIMQDNSKILSIYNIEGIEVYKITRKTNILFSSMKIKKCKLFLPI